MEKQFKYLHHGLAGYFVLLVVSVLISAGCADKSDEDFTTVKFRVPDIPSSRDVAGSVKSIDTGAYGNIVVIIKVTASDMEEPSIFRFSSDEIRENKGVLFLQVPSGYDRIFHPYLFVFDKSAVSDRFPGVNYVADASESELTVDLVGEEVELKVDMIPGPTEIFAGIVRDDRSGSLSGINGGTGCANPQVTMVFDVLKFDKETIPAPVSVDENGNFALLDVPSGLDMTFTSSDATTGAMTETKLTYPADPVDLTGVAPLGLNPGDSAVFTEENITFAPRGGVPPYDVSFFINNSGATLSPDPAMGLASGATVIYTAGPVGNSSDLLRMVDNCGNESFAFVNVEEVNVDPFWTDVPRDEACLAGRLYNYVNGVAVDVNMPNSSAGEPGYLTCAGLNNTCSFPVNVYGRGNGSVSCNMIFTTGSGSEACGLDIVVIDGKGASIARHITLDIKKVWYVNDDAEGAQTGLSWQNAFVELSDAMVAASSGEMVWVAEGIYTNTPLSSAPVLTMKSGVDVYGSFVGNETSAVERGDITMHQSVLDGEWTSYHVVVGASNSRLDGFFILHGEADGVGPEGSGGGVYNMDVDAMVLSDLYIMDNYGYYFGAGVYNYNSYTTLSNSLLMNNSAYYGGAGMFNFYSDPLIENTEMVYNYVGGYYYSYYPKPGPGFRLPVSYDSYSLKGGGGAISNFTSSPTIIYSYIGMNYAVNGGGIININHSNPVISDTGIIRNAASTYGGYGGKPSFRASLYYPEGYGGGIANFYYSSPFISDTILLNNSAIVGGGMANALYSSPSISNVYFEYNRSDDSGYSPQVIVGKASYYSYFSGGGGMANLQYSSPSVTSSYFYGNSCRISYGYGNGILNVESSPYIYDTVFVDNSTGTRVLGGGMANYYYADPTIANCRFDYNYAYSGGGIFNYLSNPEISGTQFSYNSAYRSGGAMYNVYSEPTIDGADFQYNVIYNYMGGFGGAINNLITTLTVNDSIFEDNGFYYVGGAGGAISNGVSSNLSVNGCKFVYNYASDGGAVFNSSGSTAMIRNSVLDDNGATYGANIFNNGGILVLSNDLILNGSSFRGGGIYTENTATVSISGSTFSGNYGFVGGGITNNGSDVTITDTIMWAQSASSAEANIYNISGTVNATYSNIPIFDPYTYSYVPFPGAGNIADDPLFVTGPEDDYYLSQTAAGQGANSPSVDAGSDTAATLGLDDKTTRTDGVPDSGTVDMGFHR